MCIFNIKGEPGRTWHAYNELGVEWTVIHLVLMSANLLIIGQTYISEAAKPNPQHSARGGLRVWWFESKWLFWSPAGVVPLFFFFPPQIQHCAAKHSGCHEVTCPRRVLVDPEPLGWATSIRIYTFFENTVNALERSDKDSNFASQCTLCQPLMANGVNNYKATLR